ncbi:cupin domain-containing protein [Microbulbifer variabilis]|uniref:Cupin domain-containing protein n=1 Tax=Microbulbifer variabilis TaxID=266805 RepID=A0ABY4VEX6_9GAMM|nr:cupin domain-containing protein [Microbulbifer variabilis]USD22870.1 cupin domain-containing protein [Microbulbifer variabilis]
MPVVSKENVEHYSWGEGCDGWHLVRTDSLGVIQERVPPGCSEVRHLHRQSEQFFFVLQGTATIERGGEEYLLSPGQGLHIAAGIPHQLFNMASIDLVFIVTSTPPSHVDRVEL